jgi:FkbM family methyltransferase
VIIEAGAYKGEDTVTLAASAARIYAFEPVPGLYAELVAATSELPNVSTYELALGGARGTWPMWRSDASSSLLAPKYHLVELPWIKFEEDPLPVQVTTLEHWAGLEGVDHVDGMWLDMQGAELQALKAAGAVLDGVTAIVLEVSRTELYEGAPLQNEVYDWLEAQDFIVVEEQFDRGFTFGNALAVR